VAASDADAGQEPGLLILVGLALGVGALVVAASAGLFLGIGAFGDDGSRDDDPAAEDGVAAPADADGSGEVSDEDPGDADGSGEVSDEDPVDGTGGADPDAAVEDPADGTEDGTGTGAEPEPGADDDADDADGDGSGEVSDGDEGDGSPAIPPEDISVQVLDGYGGDGGAAADAVAAELAEAGYRIIAQNPALAYEVTTVLWTAGFEDEGRQVAAEIGATEAREQPGNLSDSVMIHVVVGADRG